MYYGVTWMEGQHSVLENSPKQSEDKSLLPGSLFFIDIISWKKSSLNVHNLECRQRPQSLAVQVKPLHRVEDTACFSLSPGSTVSLADRLCYYI